MANTTDIILQADALGATAVDAASSADSDADGVPDSIERLLGLNPAAPGIGDATNTTLRLRIHSP